MSRRNLAAVATALWFTGCATSKSEKLQERAYGLGYTNGYFDCLRANPMNADYVPIGDGEGEIE